MNGKQAKRARKAVYGSDYSTRARTYAQSADGNIIADPRRRLYQNLKKEYNNAMS